MVSIERNIVFRGFEKRSGVLFKLLRGEKTKLVQRALLSIEQSSPTLPCVNAGLRAEKSFDCSTSGLDCLIDLRELYVFTSFNPKSTLGLRSTRTIYGSMKTGKARNMSKKDKVIRLSNHPEYGAKSPCPK